MVLLLLPIALSKLERLQQLPVAMDLKLLLLLLLLLELLLLGLCGGGRQPLPAEAATERAEGGGRQLRRWPATAAATTRSAKRCAG